MKAGDDLMKLAERGSLKRFTACLSAGGHSDRELYCALRAVLLKNRIDKARALLEAGANPLDLNEERDELLTHAAFGGDPELVRFMVGKGCDPNHRNVNGRTALHTAARSGRVEAIAELIELGAAIDPRDARGRTPLAESLAERKHEAAKELILCGVDLGVKIGPRNETPLILAASGRSPELVRLLLKRGVAVDERDDAGGSALMHAARAGCLEVVEILLDAGAESGATDTQGRNAFQWASSLAPEVAALLTERSDWTPERATEALLKAAGEGYHANFKRLLARGARIQPAEEGGESALVKAVLSGGSETVRTLLAHPGVEIDYRFGKVLRPALCVTAFAWRENVAKARLLIAAGANPDLADAEGLTAIQHAAVQSRHELVKLLHRSGAELGAIDPRGRTLLHLAVSGWSSRDAAAARLATVQWLIDQGLSVDAPDAAGVTPLMQAAAHADDDMVRLLLAAGSDVNVADARGHGALWHAVGHGADGGYNDRYRKPKSKKADPAAPVMENLLAAGADPNALSVLADARAWRWPGAATLLKRQGARG